MRCCRFANGKVVLASMTRDVGKAAVNHSDVKDSACITMMCTFPLFYNQNLVVIVTCRYTLDSGNSSPVTSIRFGLNAETILLCKSLLK
jgi:hypothetical protein